MTPICERCGHHVEKAENGDWFCGTCGIWVNVAGDEIGPPITEEQAKANYERMVVEAAVKIVETGRSLMGWDGLQLEHEDGNVYEHRVGEKPRLVSTSAKDTDG